MGLKCESIGGSLALTRCDFRFLLLRNVSKGGGIFLFTRCFNLVREGQYLRIIFIALVADGVYLVTKAVLF